MTKISTIFLTVENFPENKPAINEFQPVYDDELSDIVEKLSFEPPPELVSEVINLVKSL